MEKLKDGLIREVQVKTSRSGGSGGQHVNKVESKVELIFPIADSLLFTEDQKNLLIQKLAHRLDADKAIHVVCQEGRSQHANKEIAFEKLASILAKSLQVQKKRRATKPGKAAKEKRLNEKRMQAEKKISRRRDF